MHDKYVSKYLLTRAERLVDLNVGGGGLEAIDTVSSHSSLRQSCLYKCKMRRIRGFGKVVSSTL